MLNWVRYHFQHLRRWREYAEAVAKAAKDLVPEAKVYVIGGVAEDRTTVLSDIDILIIVPHEKIRKGLYPEILIRAMDLYGLPWDAPVELHIVNEKEAVEYFKLARRVVSIDIDYASYAPRLVYRSYSKFINASSLCGY